MQQKQYRNNYQQIELITYFLSIVILSLWCFIPAFVTARTGIKLQGLFSLEYYDDAIFFALKMLGVYSLIFFSYYLLNRKNYINNIKNRFLSNRSNSKTDNLVILYIVCSIILLFTLDLDAILNSSMRHVSSPILLNIQLVFLYIYFRLIIKKERNIYDSIFSSLVCITYLIYPIANSSRAVILPFAINILIILSTNRSKFRLIPNVLLTATFLSSSLITRGDLGIGNFFNVIFNSNLDELSYAVISTLLGVGQVSVALDYFSINPTYDFFLFLLYLSPLPSGYLPEGIRKINFSTILDISYVGINTDIISEWVFFFGKTGWLYGGIFFALLVIIPFELIKRGHIKNFAQRLGFQISILYFFGAGYSMQLRAASRFFYYMIFITFIFNFLEKKQKLNNSFKINS
tara:strand:- start:3597 stop:4808 length:1212 start_codon:yes stop_codon:yes gene_type:complete